MDAVLCDRNVARKYVSALEDADGLSVTTVADALDHDAADVDIAAYATANDWVLLTSDDDFYRAGGDHGLLVYGQVADPSPGGVVRAIHRIDSVYDSDADVVETVPGQWV